MELKLNQAEIEAALVEYIGSQGIDTTEKDITVNMTAGRKGNGFSADISIKQIKDSPLIEPGFPGITSEDPDTEADPSVTLFGEE